jgi:hypothetical protein
MINKFIEFWTSKETIECLIIIGGLILASIAFGGLMALIGYFRDKRKWNKY